MVGRHHPPCSRAGRERLVFTAGEGKGEFKLYDLPTGTLNLSLFELFPNATKISPELAKNRASTRCAVTRAFL